MSRFSTNFNSNKGIPYQRKDGNSFVPARVKDIILDSTHPEYDKFGGPNSVGVIKYELVGKTNTYDETEQLPGAFPLNNTVRTLPLKNEIVLLQVAPDSQITELKSNNKITYYTSIVGLWNHPNHNASPSDGDENVELGDDVDESDVTNPMQPFPGDFLLEGRLGQSLRLTGYKGERNIFTDDENNGLPLTILSNGQEDVGNAYDHLVENVNDDYSSMYLTSDHRIVLDQARVKYDSMHEAPVRADQFRGNQVIINGGRLFFNAKTDDINLAAQNNISATSDIIGLDGEQYIGLDANKIYLGKRAKELEAEPVIKGDTLEIWLNQLIKGLEGVAKAMTKAKTIDQKIIPNVNKEGIVFKAKLKSLTSQINPGGKQSQLKSRKVFTE